MKVAVLPNLDKKGSAVTVERIGVFFKEQGIEAYLPDNICCDKYEHLPEEELYKIADIIVTIGGDGTIIRYAKRAAVDNKPIVGINAGRMGYLANIEQNEYKLLSKLKTGEYDIEKRMMLNIKLYENGKEVGNFNALNDAVITSGYISRIIDVSASVDGDSISYRADGLIVSTPTGSTAYSMSAGGPIIDPLTENFCITPICSHSLSAKPILLSAERTVKLKAFSKKRTDIFLIVDGRRAAPVKPYTDIIVSRSERSVQLIRLNNRSFYKTLSFKFTDSRSMNVEK
ncbi:MAG: NAD(+)/NADH kinase [Ruminococcaceae bacterium]|nr:NAD(+)/NADH kinase [Oscillospiraceae bacterium]